MGITPHFRNVGGWVKGNVNEITRKIIMYATFDYVTNEIMHTPAMMYAMY